MAHAMGYDLPPLRGCAFDLLCVSDRRLGDRCAGRVARPGRPVIADLKKIYQAATIVEAEQALEDFAQVWDAKYPTIAKMWRAKWTDIITLFDFPAPIRRAIYTTNAIESVNSVIRKFTRNRKIYPNEESALKIVYMAIHEASKKWTMPIRHWKQALNHFAILYEGRMPEQTSK